MCIGVASEKYVLTSGYKSLPGGYWKWLGGADQYIGASGPTYWFNEMTKNKPQYDCQALYVFDPTYYASWASYPCNRPAVSVCEYQVPGLLSSPTDGAYISELLRNAPNYLQPTSSKGVLAIAPSSRPVGAPLTKGVPLAPTLKGSTLVMSPYAKGMVNMAPYLLKGV